MTAAVAKPLVQALAATGLGVLAFAVLAQTGVGAEPSLIAALILAGGLNIAASATLNGDALLPTSVGPVGDLSR